MASFLIIRRSAVQVRLPLPIFPYTLQGLRSLSAHRQAGTAREQSEHTEQSGAQNSAQAVAESFTGACVRTQEKEG